LGERSLAADGRTGNRGSTPSVERRGHVFASHRTGSESLLPAGRPAASVAEETPLVLRIVRSRSVRDRSSQVARVLYAADPADQRERKRVLLLGQKPKQPPEGLPGIGRASEVWRLRVPGCIQQAR
jgi:hypothetical protein